MKKPRYIIKLYAFIFLSLGCAFIFMGFLCFIGIVKPSEHSDVQDPIIMGIIFCLIGVISCVVQTVLRLINAEKNKLHGVLLESGTKLNGTVEKVYLQKYTQYGEKSPFRVCYTYTHQGKSFHHESHLLWDKPKVNVGDSIQVFANDSGKSTIQL